MQLHSLIVDDFLDHFDDWRSFADTAKYSDVRNPVDGVVYPAICESVPSFGIANRLSMIMGVKVRVNCIFMRLSLARVLVPHQAHNDASMGQYSAMIYMNREKHCRGGTSLVRHIDDDIDLETLKNDSNTPDRWKVLSMCEMKQNRAFIFRSDLLHRAEPLGGFGDSPRNGRLVLTCFFNT